MAASMMLICVNCGADIVPIIIANGYTAILVDVPGSEIRVGKFMCGHCGHWTHFRARQGDESIPEQN